MTARPNPRATLGRLGEELAARHLQRDGARILARRVRTSAGELDLVALEGNSLVFVEVKSRLGDARAGASLDPLEGIGAHKRARLRRAGAAWLSEQRARPYARTIRFDAIGVTLDQTGRVLALEHLRDAF